MEDFSHFNCPWLRVRGDRIILLVVLCSILTVKAVVNAESNFMCYNGQIITTETHKISLTNKSLSKNFTLKMCQAPTTTAEPETEPMTTTMVTDMPANPTSMETMETTSLTTNPETEGNTSPITEASTETPSLAMSTNDTTSQGLTTVHSATTPTDSPSDGSPTSPSPKPGGEGRRRRRSGDNDESSQDSNFFCQVFFYPTSEDTKVKVKSTYTLDFSCVTEYKCEENGKIDTVIDGHSGTLYCCNSTACNSPFLVIDDTDVEVETLDSCSSYNQDGVFQSVPCVQTSTHMCLKVTQMESNITEYTCGNSHSEKSFCLENNWYSERCNETDGTQYCCYVEPTFVGVPTNPPDVKPTKPPNSSVGVIIGVLVAFATGLFLGCVGLVVLQRKCGRGRTSGIEMDFSYSRFQSADSGTDEL